MSLQLRPATPADIPAITAIYAVEVEELVNTYEYEVPDEAEMARRMADITARGFPYLVATIDDQVAGYAYANSYRARIAYQWTVENSVYVDGRFQGKGVGSALMQALIDACTARGYRQMVAVIGEPTNTASIKLHERFGFHLVGIFRGLGRKHGRWLDTVQMQRALGDGTDSAPPMNDAMNDSSQHAGTELLAGQPVRIVERDGVRYTLLGTAHVSLASVQAVEEAIGSGQFDAVAVELDPQRLVALTNPNAMAQLDLVEVIRKGRVALFAANLALAAYQRRLADQLGIEPGAELKRAVTLAKENDLPVHLIDRDVGLTFRRVSQRLGFFGKIKLIAGLGAGLFSSEDVGEDEIEKLKQGDMLESSFGEFAKESPALYETIIGERDRYMATRLRQEHDSAQRNVLAVVGAGHLAGLARYLETDNEPPAQLREQLESVPRKRNVPWITLTILAVVLAGIGIGFWKGGMNMGAQMLAIWALYTGGLAGLGALLAGSHPLSILTAIAVAPFKPFRLSIPTGAFAALVETRLRKPTYQDFLQLRDDAQTLKGWYRNRVTRITLTFMLTNLGSMLGLWLTGFSVYGKLAG